MHVYANGKSKAHSIESDRIGVRLTVEKGAPICCFCYSSSIIFSHIALHEHISIRQWPTHILGTFFEAGIKREIPHTNGLTKTNQLKMHSY